jgi:phage-related protein
VIAQLAGDLGDQLSLAILALTPALVNVSTALADILANVDPLLPVIGQLVGAIAPLLTWLTSNPKLLADAAIAWAALTAAEWAATTAMTAFDVAADANPIGIVILAIAAIVAGIILLVENWKTVKQWGSDAWNAIKDAGVAVWHWMEGVGQDISNWFGNVMDWFSSLPGKIGDWLAELPGAIGQAFQNAFDQLGELIGFAFGLVVGEFFALPGQIGSALSSFGSLLAGVFSSAWAWVWQEIQIGWANVSDFFAKLPGRVGDFISGLPGMLKNAFHTAWQWAKQEVSDGADAVVDFARKLPGRIMGFFDNIGHTILSGLKSGINSVIDSFNKGIDDAAGWTHISLPHLPHFAAGGIVDSPTLAVIGEGGNREVVLPANNPLRAQELLEQSGLMSQMKMGMQVPTINFTAVLGTGEILTVLDTRVDMKVNSQVNNLASGVRSM